MATSTSPGDPVDPATGVEPGQTTTEFWITVIAPFVTAVVGLAVAFGAPIDENQKTAILAVVIAGIPFLAAVYTLGRSLRKGLAGKP